MISGADVYTDLQGLAELRARAKADPRSAKTLKDVASQFEAIFTQMVLKSMRDAGTGDDLFANSEGNLYRDLYDQQIALLLSKGKGIGLADMLVRQLGGAVDTPKETADRAGANPAGFVSELWPHAQAAAKKLNIAPEALISQAALETGWGRATIRKSDGSASYNVFGIKADTGWKGPTANSPTLEYVDGIPQRSTETFRAYGSYAEGFEDYARFLQDNPRYGDALKRSGDVRDFVQGLAQAGYATDPAYGAKIRSILDGDTLRDALAGLKNGGIPPLTS
jgi:peptidoglycan hydrolase FlgJ